jgi:hypothetical protein
MPEDPPAGAQAGPDDADLPKPAPADSPSRSPEQSQAGAAPPPGAVPPPGAMPPPAEAMPPADPWQQPAESLPVAGAPAAPPPATGEPAAPPYAWPQPGGPVPPAGTPTAPYAWPQPGGPVPPAGTPTAPYPWQVPPSAPARPRRRNRMVFLTSGLLLVLLALLVVPLVVNRGDDGSPPAGGNGGNGGNAPSAVPAASPEQYQLALTSTDGALAASWRKLSQARTPATVRNAADALALAVQSEAEKLGELTPPDQVTAAHSQLVTALEAFSERLSAGSTEDVCSGSSAAPRLSKESALNQVRAAAQAVAAADPAHPYRVGTWVPKAGTEPKRRLSNGKYLKRTVSNGSGQLRIKNGGSADAVVSIVAGNGKQPAIVVYVRGKQNFTVRGVRDGTYRVFLTSGADWDAPAKTFSRDCAFERFDDTFKFQTTSTTFTIWEITVQAVSGGNASATSVSPDDFPIG